MNPQENLNRIEDRKFMSGFLIALPILFILFGIGILIFSDHKTNLNEWGDFIGGVVGSLFSLAGVLLLFLTLKDQRDSFFKERFETRFFEMIKLHRENVNEISYSYVEKKEGVNAEIVNIEITDTSRKVFYRIFKDFEILHDDVAHFFAEVLAEDVYEIKYLNELRKNRTLADRNINLVSYAKVDILYCIIFFGVGKSGISTLKTFFNERYLETFYEPLLAYSALKPKKESKHWSTWKRFQMININKRSDIFIRWRQTLKVGISEEDRDLWGNGQNFIEFEPIFKGNNFEKYYGGHQFRLGHYFRHLYQTVTYVNESALLTYKEKYENVKLLRGQLSTYEQVVFFLNSISALGRIWELEMKNNPSGSIDVNQQLLTKYNLIKNIAADSIKDDIKVSMLYPLISYEAIQSQQSDVKRAQLEAIYI